MKRTAMALVGFGAALTAGVLFLTAAGLLGAEKDYQWSIGIYAGYSPFELAPAAGARNPVLTGSDVTDRSAAFVADPFLFRDGDAWYMFFEILDRETGQGDIAYASSTDGLKWQYEKVVIDEPFHLSYPQVFSWKGTRYLVPESLRDGTVRLYRASDFPRSWEFAGALLEDVNLSDPSLLRHNGRWWIFAESNPAGNDTLDLFYADDLLGPYRPHPQSPVVRGNCETARPAGRMLVVDGKLYRFTMNCDQPVPAGGDRVRAVEIVRLTATEYEERLVDPQTVVQASGAGWNRDRMHHVDAHRLDSGRWIAAVDGCRIVRGIRVGPFALRFWPSLGFDRNPVREEAGG